MGTKSYSVNPKRANFSIEPHKNEVGMGWVLSGIFIVGTMAGGGLVALPYTFVHTGLYAGILCILLGAIISGYTGIQLGHNWTLMQNRWSEYKEHCRNPYPEMAYRALGTKMKNFVQLAMFANEFGVVVVYLLLASKNISNFLHVFFGFSVDFCLMILAVALVIWPFGMLKSPKDFWYIAVGACFSTTLAVVLLIAGSARDAEACLPQAMYPEGSVEGFFFTYGTVMFAFGGHAVFPTIQHDMKKPYHFNRSVYFSYFILLVIYLPVSIIGYLVYGSSLQDSIIPSIQTIWIQQTVNVFITMHVTLTILIDFSPLCQGIEHLVNTPHEFGWRRVFVRTCVLFCVVFVAESVPHFGIILDLVGATLESLMTMLLPSVFYLYLFAAKRKREERKKREEKEKKMIEGDEDMEYATLTDIFKYTPRNVLLFNILCLTIGLVGGLISTYLATSQLFQLQLSPPCYVRSFLTEREQSSTSASTICCGGFKNVTTSFFQGQCSA